MHNVAPEKLFRPSVWSALGTADPEGADYRACANFGPLYGRSLGQLVDQPGELTQREN